VLARVYRWPGASPQMEVGHDARRTAFETAVAEVPGLTVIGAGLRGSGIPNSIADGAEAARQVVERLAAAPALAIA